MEDEIDKVSKKLSQEVKMKPVIDKEAARLLKEKIAKDPVEAAQQAAKNVAAQYINITELASGEIKDLAKSSISSDVFARALRDMTPQHIQAVVNNFKTKTSNEVIKKTFAGMFTGKNDEENADIFDKYAQENPGTVNWALRNPAAQQMNLPFRNYMRDPYDQPTSNFNAFEKRRRIQDLLEGEELLSSFYKTVKEERKLAQKIRKSVEEGSTVADEDKEELNRAREDIKTARKVSIEPFPERKTKWEEIEKLMQPGRRRRN